MPRVLDRPRWSLVLLSAAALLHPGCGTETGPGQVHAVEVVPNPVLLVGPGTVQTLEVRLTDPNGGTVQGVAVVWSSGDPSVAQVDASTGIVTSVGAGTTLVAATVEGVVGTASVEVHVPAARVFSTGTPFLGREGYVEYIPGDVPVVVSAPHGGDLQPAEIPERTFGVTGQDRRTQETARLLVDAIGSASGGGTPHVVINRLHRSRLDANREIVEAAQGSVFAEHAWSEYHEFLDSAKTRAVGEFGRALFLDLHGHGHPEQRLELGYLLSAEDLNSGDAVLDGLSERSSVRRLADESSLTFSQLIRGSRSLGGLLADGGIRAVPSPDEPGPGTQPFFSGGYNTARHGSRDGGLVDGIQLELNWTGIRETREDRSAFAVVLAEVLQTYLSEHLEIEWSERP